MSEEYIFGAHILESLTRGMYQDSKTIFREYIQNSCDAIDSAVKAGILCEVEGRIDINLDNENRKITIIDNGTGIKSSDFRRVMGNIADSDKRQGEDRGFRGIGRLCGLAYCETVVFTAKFKGESVRSRLVCNAKILHDLLIERDSGISRYTASEMLDFINEFITEETSEDINAHYFIVELYRINKENIELLDFDIVKKYLSFTVPVPYSITFDPFGSEIHRHAKELGLKIDEYKIYLNDEQLFKTYTTSFNIGRGKGTDEFFSLKFEDFRDINNNLVAWLWFGVSNFKGAMDETCLMRGIRLRKENIQVGNEYTLRKFFKEARGIHYFAGEIFCISQDLIPNSQRDFFSENPERAEFEKQLENYFKELSKIFHDGSVISSSFKKINEADRMKSAFTQMSEAGNFTSDDVRQEAELKLQEAEEAAIQARTKIDSIKHKGSSISKGIIGRLEENSRSIPVDTSCTISHPTTISKFTYKQKLLNKVFDIIRATVDGHTADKLITRISDRLQ